MSSRGAVEGELSVGDAVALLPRVLDRLVSAPWWKCSDAELAELVRVFARAESRCAAGGVAVLAEAMGRGLPAAAGAKNGGCWLRGQVPVTPSVGRARAGLAEAFGTAAVPAEGLAPTAAAFAAGDISAGHASVVVQTMDAVTALPEVDQATAVEAQVLLLEAAAVLDPAQLGQAGRRLRHRLDPDAADRLARDEDRQQEARYAWLVQESSGMWALRGLLPPVAGAALSAALDPLTAPQPAIDGTPDPRTGQQRTADALHGLADLSLAARQGEPGALPSRGGASTRLVLTAELDTLLATPTTTTAGGGGHCGSQAGLVPPVLVTGDAGGWEISPLTLQMLACDGEMVPVLTDPFGRALDVGQTLYPFPPRIRRAIEVRDQHCTYPNCRAKPAWCHVHHLIRFGPDGPPAKPTGRCSVGGTTATSTPTPWSGRSSTATSPGGPDNSTDPTTTPTPSTTLTSNATNAPCATSPDAGSPATPTCNPTHPTPASPARPFLNP